MAYRIQTYEELLNKATEAVEQELGRPLPRGLASPLRVNIIVMALFCSEIYRYVRDRAMQSFVLTANDPEYQSRVIEAILGPQFPGRAFKTTLVVDWGFYQRALAFQNTGSPSANLSPPTSRQILARYIAILGSSPIRLTTPMRDVPGVEPVDNYYNVLDIRTIDQASSDGEFRIEIDVEASDRGSDFNLPISFNKFPTNYRDSQSGLFRSEFTHLISSVQGIIGSFSDYEEFDRKQLVNRLNVFNAGTYRGMKLTESRDIDLPFWLDLEVGESIDGLNPESFSEYRERFALGQREKPGGFTITDVNTWLRNEVEGVEKVFVADANTGPKLWVVADNVTQTHFDDYLVPQIRQTMTIDPVHGTSRVPFGFQKSGFYDISGFTETELQEDPTLQYGRFTTRSDAVVKTGTQPINIYLIGLIGTSLTVWDINFKPLLERELSEFLQGIIAFVPGLDPINERNDIITQNALCSVVYSFMERNGLQITDVFFETSDVFITKDTFVENRRVVPYQTVYSSLVVRHRPVLNDIVVFRDGESGIA